MGEEEAQAHDGLSTLSYLDQRGQEHPIGLAAAWPAHLPMEHRELVTQDEYLDLVRGL